VTAPNAKCGIKTVCSLAAETQGPGLAVWSATPRMARQWSGPRPTESAHIWHWTWGIVPARCDTGPVGTRIAPIRLVRGRSGHDDRCDFAAAPVDRALRHTGVRSCLIVAAPRVRRLHRAIAARLTRADTVIDNTMKGSDPSLRLRPIGLPMWPFRSGQECQSLSKFNLRPALQLAIDDGVNGRPRETHV